MGGSRATALTCTVLATHVIVAMSVVATNVLMETVADEAPVSPLKNQAGYGAPTVVTVAPPSAPPAAAAPAFSPAENNAPVAETKAIKLSLSSPPSSLDPPAIKPPSPSLADTNSATGSTGDKNVMSDKTSLHTDGPWPATMVVPLMSDLKKKTMRPGMEVSWTKVDSLSPSTPAVHMASIGGDSVVAMVQPASDAGNLSQKKDITETKPAEASKHTGSKNSDVDVVSGSCDELTGCKAKDGVISLDAPALVAADFAPAAMSAPAPPTPIPDSAKQDLQLQAPGPGESDPLSIELDEDLTPDMKTMLIDKEEATPTISLTETAKRASKYTKSIKSAPTVASIAADLPKDKLVDDKTLWARISTLKAFSKKGGMNKGEYFKICNFLNKDPGINFLVYGLGFDSALYQTLNRNGNTHFLEFDTSWVHKADAKTRALKYEKVKYTSSAFKVDEYMRNPVPISGVKTFEERSCWDTVLIDSPLGIGSDGKGSPKNNGRQQPMYMTAMQAQECLESNKLKEMTVFVHENKLSTHFFGQANLVSETGPRKLREYRLKPGFRMPAAAAEEQEKEGAMEALS